MSFLISHIYSSARIGHSQMNMRIAVGGFINQNCKSLISQKVHLRNNLVYIVRIITGTNYCSTRDCPEKMRLVNIKLIFLQENLLKVSLAKSPIWGTILCINTNYYRDKLLLYWNIFIETFFKTNWCWLIFLFGTLQIWKIIFRINVQEVFV